MATLNSKLSFTAGIFDLDGVVTHTARVHAHAWKEMFDEYLKGYSTKNGIEFVPFDAKDDYRIYVDGKPRYKGVESFFESRGIALPFGTPQDEPQVETYCGLGNRKNELYNELLKVDGVDVFDTTVDFIKELHSRGVRVGLMSSSKNTLTILRITGLEDLFECRVDGVVAEELGLRGKPHPDSYLKAATELGVSPQDSFVVEDAVSGVEAGKRGEFGLVIGVDREGHPEDLTAAGADIVIKDMGEITVDQVDELFQNQEHARPSALEQWEKLTKEWKGKRVAVFLDYDGTLTPIVATPDLAKIARPMRHVLRDVADTCPTVIVSGRGREDVAALVGLDNLYFAGSHGFDIAGPKGTAVRNEIGKEYLPILEESLQVFNERIAGIEGALIEDKKFSIAVHFRLVDEALVPGMEQVVDEVVAKHPQLKKAHGKKVFEVRPKLEWNKGKAVLWLLKTLELDRPDVVPLFIGDDVTDEDAFAALEKRGLGILVSETPRETKAHLALKNPNEVGEFLKLVSNWQRSQ
jgi:alpha,alpha-trehalase